MRQSSIIFVIPALFLYVVGPLTAQVYDKDNFTTVIQPQQEIVLSSAMQGLVSEVYCQPQDYVKAGDSLIKLDSDLVELEIKSIKEQLRLSTVEKEAQIRLTYMNETLDIIKKLHAKVIGDVRVGSEKELKEAQQSYDLAVEGVKKAELDVVMLNLKLAGQQKSLQLHTIKAPVDGVIVPFNTLKHLAESKIKKVEKGEMITQAQPAVALMKIDRLRISQSLSDSQIDKVHLNQDALVYIAGTGSEPISAKVVYKSPAIIGAVAKFYIEVEFSNPPVDVTGKPKGTFPFKYRPGMNARVELK